MKLAPILFVERAPTAGEALASGIAGFVKSQGGGEKITVVLVDALKTKDLIKKNAEELQGADLDAFEDLAYRTDPKEYVRGYVFVKPAGFTSGLYRVGYSAGIDKYGPLAYRIAMELITQNGGWLRSDTSISDDAVRVWNKMYELSEQGIYQRMFLGDFGANQMLSSISAATPPWQLNALEKIAHQENSEELFLAELQRAGIPPQEVGWFWAYQTTKRDPETVKLLNAGKSLHKAINAELEGEGISLAWEEVLGAVVTLGEKFFSYRYND